MTPNEPQDTITLLDENIARGESSMDTAMRMYGFLKQVDMKLAKEFTDVYTDYYNGDLDEFPIELRDRAVAAITNNHAS